MSETTFEGRCLCGAIHFEAKGPMSLMALCHCKQCQQWSGHAWPSVAVSVDHLTFTQGAGHLTWYVSSDFARRGFCKTCGSSLFWQADRDEAQKDQIAIAAGSINDLKGLQISKHIFCCFKGSYYEICDDLEQRAD